MSPSRLNRRFAMPLYVIWSILAVLATIECFHRGVGFHIIIFGAYILIYMTGFVAALKYILDIEIWVAKLGVFFGILNILAMFLLIPNVTLEWLARTWIIQTLNALWFIYRLIGLKWLEKEAKKVRDVEWGQ